MGAFLSANPRLVWTAAWTLSTFGLYGVFVHYCRRSETFKSKPHIAAYNTSSMLLILAMCYYGLKCVGRLDYLTQMPPTVAGRMYGFDADVEKIILLQNALQIFALTIAGVTRDKGLCKPEVLGHHVVCLGIMNSCLHPFCHAYGAIMFGLTELSTVPLNVLDTLKTFKSLSAKYPTVFIISKAAFAISFLFLRCGLSTKLSIGFQRDLYELYATGTAHSNTVVMGMSVSNLFIVALQLYWGSLVAKGMYGMFFGAAGKGKKDAKVED